MGDNKYQRIADDVVLGENLRLAAFINLYGCTIGDETGIGTFVEIQRGASVGKRCKIQSHTFICGGVTIEDEVFVGHGVMFVNDLHPRAVGEHGLPEKTEDWADRMVYTTVQKGAMVGSGAIIMGGITIGEGAVIGAGAVVTKDVPAGETWVGVPACPLIRS